MSYAGTQTLLFLSLRSRVRASEWQLADRTPNLKLNMHRCRDPRNMTGAASERLSLGGYTWELALQSRVCVAYQKQRMFRRLQTERGFSHVLKDSVYVWEGDAWVPIVSVDTYGKGRYILQVKQEHLPPLQSPHWCRPSCFPRHLQCTILECVIKVISALMEEN